MHNNFINLPVEGGGGGGSGTVTSVGLSAPSSILTVSGSPVTTAGILALALKTQNANKFWLGPASGADANPTFRVLDIADIPDALITNAKLADMATLTIKGNSTGGAAAPSDLSVATVTSMLNVFVGDSGSGGTKGLVKAPVTGDANKYLRGNGNWDTLFVDGLGIGTSTKSITAGSSTDMLFSSPASGSYTLQVNGSTRFQVNNFGIKMPTTFNLGTNTGAGDPTANAIYLGQANFSTTTNAFGGLAWLYGVVAGSNGGRTNYGIICNVDGSSTAANKNIAIRGVTSVSGSGNDISNNLGNIGGQFEASTGSGTNIGLESSGFGGLKNWGLAVEAANGLSGGQNIGVQSCADYRTVTTRIGGYFTLTDSPGFVFTPSGNAGLIASNGNSTDDIFRAEDNGSAVFSIKDGGVVNAQNLTASKAVFTDASKNLVSTSMPVSFSLKTIITPVSNTGASESNLITYTLPANTLNVNADYLYCEFDGSFASNDDSKQLRVYLGATQLFNSSSVAQNGGAWSIQVTIVRLTSTTQFVSTKILVNGGFIQSRAFNTSSSEDLTTSLVIKCTGTCDASSDVTQNIALFEYIPAAP